MHQAHGNVRAVRWLVGLAVSASLMSCAGTDSPTVANESLSPDIVLRIVTDLGDIGVDLYEEAAPASAHAVLNLIQYGVTQPGVDDESVETGYYDGLFIDHTHPNVEIRLAKAQQHESIRIPKEINASAIGLDRDIIETTGQAMDTYQFEIHKEYGRNKSSTEHSDQLVDWISLFGRHNNADFLIGKSRKDINEALGYVYVDSGDSRPVERGSVLLEPHSKSHSSPRLVIALDAIPRYTGKWTVIGQVTEGIDLAHAISRRANSGRVHPRWTPHDPVQVQRVELAIRPDP